MARVSTKRGASHGPDTIEVFGAREHNLDVPHLVIPKHAMVVFTGPSGSGKSSLAFDTLYAEGQRRYTETLSAYARQFLGQVERPHVDKIRGLSPTIAIEQKSASSNPRSTVGTITEIYDYMRVLFARCGEARCLSCKRPVRASSAAEIARELAELPAGTKVVLVARIAEHRKGTFVDTFSELKARGFLRVEVDGAPCSLDDPPTLEKKDKHTIDLVVDRVVIGPGTMGRITEAVELALAEGRGELRARATRPKSDRHEERVFSAARMCCGRSYPELTPQLFSFNSPVGMCPSCSGLGTRAEVDPERVVRDASLSIRDGAIVPWASAMQRGDGWVYRIAEAAAAACRVDLDAPFRSIPKAKQTKLLHGIGDQKLRVRWGGAESESQGTFGVRFEGVIPHLTRLYYETSSEAMREHYRRFFVERPCRDCDGTRLRPESRAVELGGLDITATCALTVADVAAHFQALSLTKTQREIATLTLSEITTRLAFLLDVGLAYLTLDRAGPTLSGGEAQRIRLASQLGSELSGVMYVLDEPSIGLHPRDNARLIATLRHLRDLGNTVLVVEHDEETIRAADHVVDFGPGAGHMGGRVVAEGTPDAIARAPVSPTGAYLSGRRRIEVPARRRPARGQLEILGARENNLKSVDVAIPLGVLSCITGPSGAGKSTLVGQILLPALGRALHDSDAPVGAHESIRGIDAIRRVVAIDQQPIGRTPRSNPGTYTKAFDIVREIFSGLPEARARGFSAGRFSFNVKGGRCEACHGDGVVRVEMHFLSDVFVKCEVCQGRRYEETTLAVRFKGKSIADVLDTSIDDCLELFAAFPALTRILRTLVDVGLGYMKLGQPATTLSGGEAQRVKLSRELGKSQSVGTLYVLDEPTTGLHFDDVRRLLDVLQTLVDQGSTVVVIEHNLDVVKCADWVVDLGPEGGDAGGRVVAAGTPEAIARERRSPTGEHLRPLLEAKSAKLGGTRRR